MPHVNNRDRVWRAVKQARHFFGSPTLMGSSSELSISPPDAISALGVTDSNNSGIANSEQAPQDQITSGFVHDDIPDNAKNPLRRRIFKTKRFIDLLRKPKNFYYLFFPKPTEMDLQNKREMQERKKLETLLKSESSISQTRFHGVLKRMGITEKTLGEKRGVTGKVRFDKVWYNPNSIYLRVGGMPFGVSVLDLTSDDVVTNLSEAVRHRVSVNYNYTNGIIYRIDRNSAAGLPNLVTLEECLTTMPASLPPLSFPIGKIANGKIEYGNVDEGPHILIAGETMAGKSNMLNAIIGSIAYRTTPADVRIFMTDLKGNGIELLHWEGLPHIIKRSDLADLPVKFEKFPELGIAGFPEEAMDVINCAVWYCDQRLARYAKARVKNIDQWNRSHRKKRDPHFILVIDEWTLVCKSAKGSKDLLSHLAQIARAAGIHIITAMQNVDKTIFNSEIKTNFPMRLGFSFQDFSASTLVVGNSMATNLDTKGRAVFKHGVRRFLTQTPFISNADIQTIKDKTTGKKADTKFRTAQLSEQDVIEWALGANYGELTFSIVFDKFKERIDKRTLIQMLKDMEGHTYSIGEYDYRVDPGFGSRARQITKVDDPNATPVDVETRNGIQNTNDNSALTQEATIE